MIIRRDLSSTNQVRANERGRLKQCMWEVGTYEEAQLIQVPGTWNSEKRPEKKVKIWDLKPWHEGEL